MFCALERRSPRRSRSTGWLQDIVAHFAACYCPFGVVCVSCFVPQSPDPGVDALVFEMLQLLFKFQVRSVARSFWSYRSYGTRLWCTQFSPTIALGQMRFAVCMPSASGAVSAQFWKIFTGHCDEGLSTHSCANLGFLLFLPFGSSCCCSFASPFPPF